MSPACVRRCLEPTRAHQESIKADGYEVAQALRAAAMGWMRIVAVSGYAQPEDVKRAIEAGFDAHVAKPPDPGQIERLLA